VDDPVVAELCMLSSETILQEARAGLDRRRKLLKKLAAP
jgi:hypothetical protein